MEIWSYRPITLHQVVKVILTLTLLPITKPTLMEPLMSTSASSRRRSIFTKTPNEYTCLKSHTDKADIELSCKSETLEMLDRQLNTFVHASAHRGDPFNNLRLTLRDTHLKMKENYAKLIYSVGRNIFPLIVAMDCENPDLCGVGGTFKLYLRDGSMKRTPKVPDEFEMYKYLSHMVLGVFSIVSPYFKANSSLSWISPLQELQSQIQNANYALSVAGTRIGPLESKMADEMFKIVNHYIIKSIAAKRVEESTYATFAKTLAPYIDKSMIAAAKVQAAHILPLLKQWKVELGNEWKDTFAVIPTVWPVSKINVRLQMLEQVMDFEQLKQQVLVVEGARDEDEAVTTLGRIIADRAIALLVFGGINDEDAKDHAFSLSTRRDILSTHAGRAIKEYCDKSSKSGVTCPMAKKFATMIE